MSSAILQLLHEERRTEMYEGNKRHIIVAFFPEITQTVTQLIYIAADCCLQRDRVTVVLRVLLYRLYSLQLNCTYSNYPEAAATCSAAQQHSTFTVQILYKLYSLQLNCT